MNPYLKRLREQYDGLRSGIEGVQNRAVSENRDLTEDELRSIEGQAEQARNLHKQIEDLTEIETRNAAVSDLGSKLNGGDQGDEVRSLGASNTTARDRDPGHYRSEKDGGRNSFFGDLYRSRVLKDEAAEQRIAEHNRAGLTSTAAGSGTVAPHWLTEEFDLLARQGRSLANAVRRIPLGDDPRPLTLPKLAAGTYNVVAEQAAENDATPSTDAWDSDVDVVTPKPTRGKQILSRQLLDMSSPAIDQLIYGDLIAVYNAKVEAKVAAALGAIGTPLAAEEDGTATPITDVQHFLNVTLDAAIAVRNNRKLPANIAAMSVNRYGKYLKLKDADGRPMIASPTVGQAVNVVGVGSVAVDGIVHGLGIVASDGITTDASVYVLRAADVILFEGNMLRFRFEERSGPESIELGVWAYTATLVRQGTKAVQRINVGPSA